MSAVPLRDSVAEIDLDAIAQNTARLRAHGGAGLIAVVKADAYGHGAEAASLACLDGGADMLAVATVEEALVLRHAGVEARLLVLLGIGPEEEAPACADAALDVAVWRDEQLDALDRAGRSAGSRVAVHLKVDTGLTRLGVMPDEAADAVRAVRRRRGLLLEGIYTHLANADEIDVPLAREQLDRFHGVLSSVDEPPPWRHALATAGMLALERDATCTAVRPGLGLYGVPPAPHLAGALPLVPALALRSRVVRLGRVPPGTGVSYGHHYVTPSSRLIATVPFGYADGLPRAAWPGGAMLVRGRAAPIVGRVAMDLCMLDVTDVPGVAEGDAVTIVGEDGRAARTADDLAAELGTISYEALTNIHPRVPRVYRRGGRRWGTKTIAGLARS